MMPTTIPYESPSACGSVHAPRAVLSANATNRGKRLAEHEDAGEHTRDERQSVLSSGRRGHARRARAQPAGREPDAEHQPAHDLRGDERLRHVHAGRSSSPAHDSQNSPSIAVRIALNMSFSTEKSVK